MAGGRKTDIPAILQEVENHGNLSKACRDLGVSKSTFLDAVKADSDLADRYARAKQAGIDTMMEELLDAEIKDPSVSRLEWDRKRWHASKLFANKYGDKLDLAHSGSLSVNIIRLADAE